VFLLERPLHQYGTNPAVARFTGMQLAPLTFIAIFASSLSADAQDWIVLEGDRFGLILFFGPPEGRVPRFVHDGG
jgi:hypothetical protein